MKVSLVEATKLYDSFESLSYRRICELYATVAGHTKFYQVCVNNVSHYFNLTTNILFDGEREVP